MIPGSLLLASLLLLPAPGQAAGCVVMPDGSCQVEAPRLLPPDVVEARLDGGVRVVVVPLPTGERLGLDVLVAPTGPADPELDALVGRLLVDELADPSGSARRERRRFLGVTWRLEQEPGRLRLSLQGPVADLDELLALEAARLQTFAPTGSEVARAWNDLQAERTAELARPDGLARSLVLQRSDLPERPDTARVIARFEQAWRQAAVTLLVVGQVEPVRVVERATAVLGSRPARGVPPARPDLAAPPDRLEVQAETVSRPRVLFSWPVQPAPAGSRRAAALALLREVLVAPGGTLDQRILDEGLGLRVTSRPRADRLELLAEVDGGVHPGAVEAAMELSAAELLAAPAERVAETVELARSHLLRGASRDLDSPAGWASLLGPVLADGAPPDALDRQLDLLREIQPEEVLALAREIMVPGARRTVVLTPVVTVPSSPPELP